MNSLAVACLLLAHEKESRYRRRYIQRSLRDADNIWHMESFLFRKNFRLSKQMMKKLIDDLKPFAEQKATCKTKWGIPFYLQVLAALHFFCRGSFQSSVGYLNNMSQPSVSRSIKFVTNLILEHITSKHVKFPMTKAEKDGKKQRFVAKFGMEGIIGCIDCAHIKIVAPPSNDPIVPAALYLNHKGYHSINVEIICDADEKILFANARYPGSTPDEALWEVSPIRHHLSNKNESETYLLGDSDYPLEPWLLTPFTNTENDAENKFNVLHEETRSTISKTISNIKSRFRCLLRTLHYNPAFAGKIIYVVLTLYNMCQENEDDIEVISDDETEPSKLY
uniref:Putative nuclease harbi1 n=1 Tax=Xenopsylla cheopis TaxID=163159 RepID=A0A6M2DUP9_XENCH